MDNTGGQVIRTIHIVDVERNMAQPASFSLQSCVRQSVKIAPPPPPPPLCDAPTATHQQRHTNSDVYILLVVIVLARHTNSDIYILLSLTVVPFLNAMAGRVRQSDRDLRRRVVPGADAR